MYNPSPRPSIILPTMNMPRRVAPASSAAPKPNIPAPIAMPIGRPRTSAKRPAKREEMAAGIRIDDTVKPWTMADSGPNCESKLFITVTGPMMPVSILEAQVSYVFSLKVSWEKESVPYPKRKPPKEQSIVARMYGWGNLNDLVRCIFVDCSRPSACTSCLDSALFADGTMYRDEGAVPLTARRSLKKIKQDARFASSLVEDMVA